MLDVAAALDRVERATLQRFIPPRRLNVADWLDEHRVIGREYPSPFPGPWRTSRTPYLREPLNAFVDPEVETLVLLFSSQVGKTEAQLGLLAYSYAVDPGPGMLVLPTLELADEFSTNRLAPALGTCAGVVVGTAGTKRARSTDNAIRHKRINGLPLTIAGSNSAASLASRPVRNIFGDEIDKWAASTEAGDPLSLAEQRAAAFRRRKKVYGSTPTVKGASRIEDLYERSDQRQLFAPCPRCGEAFVVRWANVRWENHDPQTAHILHRTTDEHGRVSGCGGRIEDHERGAMVAAAEWRPTAPFTGIRGYRTWAWVSPWLRLSEIVAQFLAKKDNPETLRQFVNEILGEAWEPPSDKVEGSTLLLRREQYAAEVPAGAKVLTCGVDTQDNRLEALVVGWGPGEESWVIARETFFGDPTKPDVWDELDREVLQRAWVRESGGTTRIQFTLVDSGYAAASVYTAVIPRQHRRVFASKGHDVGVQGQLISVKHLATKVGTVALHHLDASQLKTLTYSNLKLQRNQDGSAPPGFCHFPMAVEDGFFSELTAEHLITERNKYGVPTKKWALRPGVRRNETLDCFGMALAGIRVACPTAARFEALARQIDAAAGVTSPHQAVAPAPPTEERPAAPRPSRPQPPPSRTRSWRPR